MIRRQHRHDPGGRTRSHQRGTQRHRRARVPSHRLGHHIRRGSLGNCRRTSFTWAAFVITNMFARGTRAERDPRSAAGTIVSPARSATASASSRGSMARIARRGRPPSPPQSDARLEGSFHALRMACASVATNSATCGTRSGDCPCLAIRSTTALPTTTASAKAAADLPGSAFEIPKPTATGRVVCARIRAICPPNHGHRLLHPGHSFAGDIIDENLEPAPRWSPSARPASSAPPGRCCTIPPRRISDS
jgi:hypothetical protein